MNDIGCPDKKTLTDQIEFMSLYEETTQMLK